MNQEQYIDHEVRIRVLQEIASDTKSVLKSLEDKLDSYQLHVETKMDNQFKWIIATILTLFGGIILHMAKLI